MKKITIAFDCDGTLIHNGALDDHEIIANERIRMLLIILASFKNTKIVVWSGGGELWARQVGAAIGIDAYVDQYTTKNLLGNDTAGHPLFDPAITPDIAIDDIQSCELGVLNLIVHEK
jgi:phosphoserine phosphatase